MSTYNFENILILVIDDNPHMRLIITNILKSFGARRVYVAEDGSEAFEIMKTHPIDIVIVDWVMEPLDGHDFVKLIRSSPDSPAPYVPIIMLTAYTEEFRVTRGRDVGITEFIVKPVSPKTLLARLISVIDEPRGFVNSPNYKGPDRRRRRNSTYTGEERRSGQQDVKSTSQKKHPLAQKDISEDDIKRVTKK